MQRDRATAAPTTLTSYSSNKDQSNLAQGDIAWWGSHMQKKSCRYLLSYSLGGSTHREVGPGLHFGEQEVVGGQRWYHSKERWWFPKGSPLSPLCHLNQSAAICHRMSPVLTGRVNLGRNLGMKEWANVSNLEETWSCRLQKKSFRYVLPFKHNARTWQTDNGTVTSIPIGEIAFHGVT